PANRLLLFVAVGGPDIAVGDERFGQFLSAIAFHLTALKGVPRPPGAPDRVVDGAVGFGVDDLVVRSDHRWFVVPYRIRALEDMVVALQHQIHLVSIEKVAPGRPYSTVTG